jgi:hypothetical protein
MLVFVVSASGEGELVMIVWQVHGKPADVIEEASSNVTPSSQISP